MRGEAIDKILTDILWGTPTTYLGVFSRDELPHSFTRYPSVYVANTDTSTLLVSTWLHSIISPHLI